MNCGAVHRRLSAYLDRDLPAADGRAVAGHLETCRECSERWRTLRAAVDLLNDLPRVEPREAIATAVLHRLDVESRGPGLALLFRPSWAARPLMIRSLVPALALLLAALGGALLLDRSDEPLPAVHSSGSVWEARIPASGTEGNPLFPSSGVSVPRLRAGDTVPDRLLTEMREGTLFLETVVARDGSVSTVTLLGGDSEQAQPLLDALRRERFEPVLFHGRPVAVSVYRLISRMEVRSPVT
jgi:hypothetical protein